MAKRERPVHRKAALNRFTLAVGGQDPSHDAIVTPFSFARKISDTAACAAVKALRFAPTAHAARP